MATKPTKTQPESPAAAPAGGTQAIVKAASTAVSTPIDWGQSGVTGFENVHAEDLGIPFLTIIQKGSPEIDKAHPRHREKAIPGADVGDVFDIVSRQVIYKNGGPPLFLVPIHWDKYYMEWRPRTSTGGGLVRAHKDPAIINACKRNEKNQDVLPSGNVIVTTAYFHVVTLGEETIDKRFMIGMSSTQLRKSRLWLNLAQSIKVRTPSGLITPPLYSHLYELGTQPESNEKGSWMGWTIKVHSMITSAPLAEELVAAAQSARKSTAEDVERSTAAAGDGEESVM